MDFLQITQLFRMSLAWYVCGSQLFFFYSKSWRKECISVNLDSPWQLGPFGNILATFLCIAQGNSSGDSVTDGFPQFSLYSCCPRSGFLRRLIDLIIGVQKPHFLFDFLKKWKQICWFGNCFTQVLMRTYLFLLEKLSSARTVSDTSGALGYGAVLGRHWCYGQ